MQRTYFTNWRAILSRPIQIPIQVNLVLLIPGTVFLGLHGHLSYHLKMIEKKNKSHSYLEKRYSVF